MGNARAEASESKRSAGKSAAAQAETVEELKSCQQDLREARAEAKGAVAAAREAYEERAKVLEAQFNARAAALAEQYVALDAGLLGHAPTTTVFCSPLLDAGLLAHVPTNTVFRSPLLDAGLLAHAPATTVFRSPLTRPSDTPPTPPPPKPGATRP